MGLLQLLKALFGQKYLNKIIGTRTNVAKPIQMDKSSPFRRYSNSAYDDPEIVELIEKKIDEYGPYALNNKNPQELANFEDNAKRLLAAKNKQTGITEDLSDLMKMTDDDLNALAKEGNDLKTKTTYLTGDDRERLKYINNILEKAQKLPNTGKGLAEDIKAAGGKPEAEVVDITTKQKVDDTGIMKLKTELGLPEGVEPGSVADKAIRESVQYKMDQQGVKKVLDKDYVPPKTTPIDEDEFVSTTKMSEQGAKAYSANIESYRRPIIRQMLLKDTRINLSDDVRKSLENRADLQRGADPEMDPLRLLNEYYDVDFDKLDELEEIRFTARNETEAADEFLEKGGLKPKDLGDKLKDYDGDPDGLAEGGRIGFKKGKSKGLIDLINKKFGKGTVTTAENMELSPNVLQKKMFEDFNKRNRKLTDEEYDDLVAEYGEGVPQLETVADAERFVQGQKDYQAAMFRDYKAGKLDPKPGEPGRKRLLEKKMEEMEMSGDKKLMTQDEIDELMMLQTEELAPQMTERMNLKIKYPGITDDLIQKIMIDDNPQRKAEMLATLDEAFKMMDKGMSSDEILNAVKNTPRTKQADGGLNYLMGL